MEGPLDESIANVPQTSTTTALTAEPERPQKPAGGKVLQRLLDLLEPRGFDDATRALIEIAVPNESREEFVGQMFLRSASPAGAEYISETLKVSPQRKKKRGRGVVPEATPEFENTKSASAPDVAAEYIGAAEARTSTNPISMAPLLEGGGQLMGPPTATGPQWRSLGPWTIPNGQTYGGSRINVSGRVATAAVDPSNPLHVLCGSAAGGVWESFDRGESWSPRTDFAATLTVGALAFDPLNPRIVYCGTGEGNAFWWFGAGVLRSTDGGTTWSTLCTTPFVGQGFFEIVVDRANTNHLIAATTAGVFVSTDGGVTWVARRNGLSWAVSMAAAGGPAAEILAGCFDGVFRSIDGGTTWTSVALPGGPGAFDRVAVSIAPSNPDVAYVWGARSGAVYFYRRSGGTWSAQPLPAGATAAQAWYDWYCAAAPDRDNQVYCGAIETFRGDFVGGVWTWINLTNKGATGQSIHPDQHAIAIDANDPNTIYAGNDGGLFRSPDRGMTWIHCNNGLVISEFEYLAQNFGSSRWVIGGTQDNGTQRWTGDPTWIHVADGDGGDCAVNRTTPSTVFHTFFNMSPERSTTSGDFGTWSFIPPPILPGEGSLFYPPFEASANGGDTVAIGGDALYVSRNNMGSWTRIAFPTAGRSSALYIPNATTVYVGTTTGEIYRTAWNGAAWTALTALTTPRPAAYVSDIHVDPGNPNRIWATYLTRSGGRVFRSDNAGVSWTDRSAGLPLLPVNAVEVDPLNSNRVWVALDLGVFETVNAGVSWSDFSASLPNSIIGDLSFHPHARVLRAGTRNRGVWEIPVDGWMVTPSCGTQYLGNLLPNETKRWFTPNWPATWHVVWTIMPTTVRPGGPEITWSVQVERASAEFTTYWITVQNLTNGPVSFEGRYCILSKY
ncbi:MAG TPA: hypothetical protein VJP89_23650 [Pyrinomonadaceae bacterium]|nr:hypothetical protein [Pyrinomonadaceae bacterium]